MISIEVLTLFLACFAGLLLGGIYFGGLWWTVRNGVTARHPALLFLGSMIVRMTIILTGFFFISGGQWQRLLICLAGFIAARSIAIRLTRPPLDLESPVGSTGARAYIEPATRIRKGSRHAT